MKYRPEIDGLRALAVVPVILFHAGFELLSGGFVGVDVFFVISGYLITTILIEDIEKKRFSLVGFYERRARRILPALLFMLSVIALVSWIVMPPDDLRLVFQQLVSNSTFTSNIHYTLTTWGYFENWTLPPIFLNTWSLAVEEQFYIVIPILIFLFRKSIKLLFLVLVALSILSLFWAQFSHDIYPIANYYLLTSRFWELAIGSMLAISLKTHLINFDSFNDTIVKYKIDILLFFGLVSFYFILDKNIPYPSLWTLPAVLVTAGIILFVTAHTITGRALSSSYLVYIGKISYPLYLWHFPLIILSKKIMVPYWDQQLASSVAIILTVVLSIFTYHFIEQPIRKKYILRSQGSLLISSAAVLCLLAVIGYLGHTKFINGRVLSVHPEFDHLIERVPLPGGLTMNDCAARNSYTQCQLINQITNENSSKKVLIVGDSFAANLIEPLYKLLKLEENISLDARVTYACSYMPSKFMEWNGECRLARNYINDLNTNTATDIIFHIGFVGHLDEMNAENTAKDLSSLTNMFQNLLNKGLRVHVIAHRDVYTVEPKRAFLYPWLYQYFVSKDVKVVLIEYYSQWKAKGVNVFFSGEQIKRSEAYKYYIDTGHMSSEGAEKFIELQGLMNSKNLWPK